MSDRNENDSDLHEPQFQPNDDEDHEHPIECRYFSDDVVIRGRDSGVFMYAVYDGDEQVSAEVGPLNDSDLIAFAEGYATMKQRCG